MNKSKDRSNQGESANRIEYMNSPSVIDEPPALQKNPVVPEFTNGSAGPATQRSTSTASSLTAWEYFILPFYLLPTHSVSETLRKKWWILSVEFNCSFNQYNIKQFWDMRCFDKEEFAPATLRAEYLLVKRKIFEQGNQLTDLIVLDSDNDSDFKYFPEEFGSRYEVLKTLYKSTDSGSRSTVEVNYISSEDDNLCCEIIGFKRYKDALFTIEEVTAEHLKTELKIKLDDYWFKWATAARSARLDFSYLVKLETVGEMRFYELSKLLLEHQERLKTIKFEHQEMLGMIKTVNRSEQLQEINKSILEIDYARFIKLIPLPILKQSNKIEQQLESISRQMQKDGNLDRIEIHQKKSAGKKNKDFELRIIFTNKF